MNFIFSSTTPKHHKQDPRCNISFNLTFPSRALSNWRRDSTEFELKIVISDWLHLLRYSVAIFLLSSGISDKENDLFTTDDQETRPWRMHRKILWLRTCTPPTCNNHVSLNFWYKDLLDLTTSNSLVAQMVVGVAVAANWAGYYFTEALSNAWMHPPNILYNNYRCIVMRKLICRFSSNKMQKSQRAGKAEKKKV